MSIFLHSERRRPESYTVDFPHKEHKFDYSDLKSSVRSNLVDKFAHFDKLVADSSSQEQGGKTYIRKKLNRIQQYKKVLKGNLLDSKSSSLQANKMRKKQLYRKLSSIMNLGHPFWLFRSQVRTNQDIPKQSWWPCEQVKKSEYSIVNRFSSMGMGMGYSKTFDKSFTDLFGASTKQTNLAQVLFTNANLISNKVFITHFLHHQIQQPRNQNYNRMGLMGKIILIMGIVIVLVLPTFRHRKAAKQVTLETNKHQCPYLLSSSNQLSNSVPIQKLIELQNYLELTPPSEIAQLPSNYQNELLRVAKSITRALRFHHDQQRRK